VEFGLARMVLGSSAFVPISQNDYEMIAEAKAGLLELLFIEQKFDVLMENYFELETTLLESGARCMIFQAQDYRWFQLQLNHFNRRLANVLTAARAYTDQTKHHIQRILQPSCKEVQEILAEFRRQYDDRLGYRAMESLRNFVQHRGFPVHSAAYPARLIQSEDGVRFRYSVTPYLQPDDVQSDGKFKKTVLEELERTGDKIDLKFLLRDYIEGLWQVNASVREQFRPHAKKWEETLNGAIRWFKESYPDEQTCGLAAVVRDEQGRLARHIHVFKDFIEYRKHLEQKNDRLMNLTSRYITSEILKD